MKKWSVGVYVRVSRDSEYSDSDSLDNQLSFIEHYCKKNNFDIVQEYIDDGYSGTNFNSLAFVKC